MRSMSALQKAHKNQLREETPWVWLYETSVVTITPGIDPLPDTETITWLRVTNYDSPIPHYSSSTGVPVLYHPIPIVHGGYELSKGGDLPTFTVTMANISHGGANADDRISDLLDSQSGLVGRDVTVTMMNIQALDDPSSHIVFESEVSGSTASQPAVVMDLTPSTLFNSQFPPYRFTGANCRFQFGGTMCGYEISDLASNTVGGGFNFCTKSLAACEERGADEAIRVETIQRHPERWGGFSGIPRS